MIYKICTAAEWRDAEAKGVFTGSAVDIADGFIHFSTAEQVEETARRHFAGQTDLVLVEIDPKWLGGELKWEPSRGGELFPHLYGQLQTGHAISVYPLPLGEEGTRVFPELIGDFWTEFGGHLHQDFLTDFPDFDSGIEFTLKNLTSSKRNDLNEFLSNLIETNRTIGELCDVWEKSGAGFFVAGDEMRGLLVHIRGIVEKNL